MRSLNLTILGEWAGKGQFRELRLSSDNLILFGGINPVSGPRSGFQAIAVSIDLNTTKETWSLVIEKSRAFKHAVIQDRNLILTIPQNFTHSFTGYIEVDKVNGVEICRHQLNESILGVVACNEQVYFGTALQGVFRVFLRKDGGKSDLQRNVDSRFFLENVSSLDYDSFVISEFDHTLKMLVHRHTAYSDVGTELWQIESPRLNLTSMGKRFVLWDEEDSSIEVRNSKSGEMISMITLSSSPLESPIQIGDYGFAYACDDCSIHFRSWQGEDQVVFQKPTTGSIALAFDNRKSILAVAFSGNYQDTTTKLVTFQVEGL